MEIRPRLPIKDISPHLPKPRTVRNLLGLAALPLVAIACVAQQTPPPEGFARNPHYYEWSIRLVVSRYGNNVSIANLYTNQEPTLKTEAGVGLLQAKEVYCKSFNSSAGNKAGCTGEFMGTFNFASNDTITVTNNTILVKEATNEELGWTDYGIKDPEVIPGQCGNPPSAQ